MSEHEGKVVIVTGGAGHIGRAICEAFLSEGANVIACGRREPETPISTAGREAAFYCCDLRDPDQSQGLVDFAV
ncbi:MAG: SDR family NAD(P)-dependent oxidoreductase, partial [Halieaceae bacterium]